MRGKAPTTYPWSAVPREEARCKDEGVRWLGFGMEWALSAWGEPTGAWRRLQDSPVTLVSEITCEGLL